MTNNDKISAMIIIHLQNGKTIDQAIDAVFGVGSYAKIAGLIYDSLREVA